MEAGLRVAFAASSGIIVGLVVYGVLPFGGPLAGAFAGVTVAFLALWLPLHAAREEHSEPEIRHAGAPPGHKARPRAGSG